MLLLLPFLGICLSVCLSVCIGAGFGVGFSVCSGLSQFSSLFFSLFPFSVSFSYSAGSSAPAPPAERQRHLAVCQGEPGAPLRNKQHCSKSESYRGRLRAGVVVQGPLSVSCHCSFTRRPAARIRGVRGDEAAQIRRDECEGYPTSICVAHGKSQDS